MFEYMKPRYNWILLKVALRRDIFESVYHHGKYTYWKQIMKCCNIAMPKPQNKNVKYGFYKNIVSHDYPYIVNN
jgi:hypothetical protein